MADLRANGQTSNKLRFNLSLTLLTGSSTGLIISTICDNEATATVYTAAASHIQTITTLGTFAAPSASCCRFGEVDSTNHPGLYEFQFADARFAVSGATRMVITVSGFSGLATTSYEVDLILSANSTLATSTDVTALAGDITTATSVLATTTALTALGVSLSGDVTTLAGDITSAVSTLAGDITTATSGLATATALSTLSSTLSSDITTLAGDITTAISTIDGNISTLSTSLSGDITTLLAAIGTPQQTGVAVLLPDVSDISALPTSTDNAINIISYLFAVASHKILQTASTQTIKMADGSTTLVSNTVSDDGTTATRGAFS